MPPKQPTVPTSAHRSCSFKQNQTRRSKARIDAYRQNENSGGSPRARHKAHLTSSQSLLSEVSSSVASYIK